MILSLNGQRHEVSKFYPTASLVNPPEPKDPQYRYHINYASYIIDYYNINIDMTINDDLKSKPLNRIILRPE